MTSYFHVLFIAKLISLQAFNNMFQAQKEQKKPENRSYKQQMLWKTITEHSPSPRSLLVRLTVIPRPRVLRMLLREPLGRPRFAPRPVGLGLPVTSMLLANGNGNAATEKNRKINEMFFQRAEPTNQAVNEYITNYVACGSRNFNAG